jgi:hypothetical protein
MLLFIAAVLAVLWLMGFVVFHVTTGVIHILLVLAVIGIALHIARGSTARSAHP